MKLAQKDSGISPSALSALANGNIENFLIASIPGGIEASEKRGQMQQANAQTLPFELGQRRNGKIEDARKPWQALGFMFGEMSDDIFVNVTFPKGWKKKPTDHSMWSEIVDNKDRVRGMIFYKAAFYDRSAHAHLSCRFSVTNDYAKPHATVSVKDACGEVQFKVTGLESPDWNGDRAAAENLSVKQDEARAACYAYLNSNFPDHESPLAYWL